MTTEQVIEGRVRELMAQIEALKERARQEGETSKLPQIERQYRTTMGLLKLNQDLLGVMKQ